VPGTFYESSRAAHHPRLPAFNGLSLRLGGRTRGFTLAVEEINAAGGVNVGGEKRMFAKSR
jgi:hypothetical protein